MITPVENSPEDTSKREHRLSGRILGAYVAALCLVPPNASAEENTVFPFPEGATIVALGDSYAAGDGEGPFEQGTDTDTNRCRRTNNTATVQLARKHSLDVTNVACSGATTADVQQGRYGEPSQLDALDTDTDIVTISLGGNDAANISDLYRTCSEMGCPSEGEVSQSLMHRVHSDEFRQNLLDSYTAVAHQAPNAQIFVTQYPEPLKLDSVELLGYSVPSNIDSLCTRAARNTIGGGVTDIVATVLPAINGSIREAVREGRDRGLRLHLVEPPDAMSGCNALGSYVLRLENTDVIQGIGHPNRQGYERMALALENAIVDTQWKGPTTR